MPVHGDCCFEEHLFVWFRSSAAEPSRQRRCVPERIRPVQEGSAAGYPVEREGGGDETLRRDVIRDYELAFADAFLRPCSFALITRVCAPSLRRVLARDSVSGRGARRVR